ncbi:MAG: hypothetical protein VCD00_12580 [Candidatus Hydrogenedentota bacterium]
MAKDRRFGWKGAVIGICAAAVVAGALLIQAVMNVTVVPIEYAPPPTFRVGAESDSIADVVEIAPVETVEPLELVLAADAVSEDAETGYTLADLKDATALVPYIALMLDDDPAIRMEALKQFVHHDVRMKFGFVYPEWRDKLGMADWEFWDLVGEDEAAIKALLYDGLVDSVETENENSEQFAISLMHTIREMPGLDDESYEMMAWVSDSHPSSEARDYAMYHVTAHVPGSAVAMEIVRNRRYDPDPWVRWHAIGYRIQMTGTQFLP